MKYMKTSEIARAVHVHANTVRLYEEWGLLQPVPRDKNGYRLYTDTHLEQMRLARMALRCEFVEGNIRKLAVSIVKTAARGNLNEALNEAYMYLSHIKNERAKAEEALVLLQQWIDGNLDEDTGINMKRKEVAGMLNVSLDVLRNWERNGLINVPRSPENSYRLYGLQEINRLKVIRTLRNANYSMMSILRMMKHIDRGKKEGVREIINTPEPEEDVVQATDRWIATLKETEKDANEVIHQLKKMMSKIE